MPSVPESVENYEKSKKIVGYESFCQASPRTYSLLGFRCGLEIHQQLKTQKKLFCRCPAGLYQSKDEYDAEVIRHMRPTLSELGEYDGTALMEFKTRKNIIYRIKNESACTYDIDDTPPFPLNREALKIALEAALLLKTSIVGELHITRKQYLDGSIPTGFQRTAIVGIEGEIPLAARRVRIIQLSLEEDACREVSDIGHERIYTTDRLGMPLIEIVTYPDMQTPQEAAQAAHYLRFLTRSTGKVRTGSGAAREDVNVSITGGTRVEIKGVAHISWIPRLTHNEAFRQKALLEIRKILKHRVNDATFWKTHHAPLAPEMFKDEIPLLKQAQERGCPIMAVNLPGFGGVLSFFTQPGQTFADELSARLKVIACLEKPNMLHSEELEPLLGRGELTAVRKLLNSKAPDAQVIFWGPPADIETALETIEERCRLAFEGVLNETRKARPDGTNIFERILPGPDRMYPDTDSPPIAIEEELIDRTRQNLPSAIVDRLEKLRRWKIPPDTYDYILRRNLFCALEKIIRDFDQPPRFVGALMGHTLKNAESHLNGAMPLDQEKIYDLFAFLHRNKLNRNILKTLLPALYRHTRMDFEALLRNVNYQNACPEEILARIPLLREKFRRQNAFKDAAAESDWIMGQLRPLALGNMDLADLRREIDGGRL
ncbi:MAG: hypothetical protein AMJ79_03005 [Phycisphaerae bacterium SM23_30]|nr:MAG: hypothetical protein AMJ79_03005 [Phycisphaerae bacterium SM23_30]